MKKFSTFLILCAAAPLSVAGSSYANSTEVKASHQIRINFEVADSRGDRFGFGVDYQCLERCDRDYPDDLWLRAMCKRGCDSN
jgi:hypothetical protein